MSAYMDEYQHHVVYETTLEGTTPSQAFDAFARTVWWGGGGLGVPGVVTSGDSKTLEGSIRSVPLGIREGALKVSYPESFEYTLIRKSIFPVSTHHGHITFNSMDGDESTTRVVWNVYYTPLFCMNFMAKIMISFLPICLYTLKSVVEKENSSQSKHR
jgi:hypothetical protein